MPSSKSMYTADYKYPADESVDIRLFFADGSTKDYLNFHSGGTLRGVKLNSQRPIGAITTKPMGALFTKNLYMIGSVVGFIGITVGEFCNLEEFKLLKLIEGY